MIEISMILITVQILYDTEMTIVILLEDSGSFVSFYFSVMVFSAHCSGQPAPVQISQGQLENSFSMDNKALVWGRDLHLYITKCLLNLTHCEALSGGHIF